MSQNVGTLSVGVDSSAVVHTCRVIAKHLTALANELDPPEPSVSAEEYAAARDAERSRLVASMRGGSEG